MMMVRLHRLPCIWLGIQLRDNEITLLEMSDKERLNTLTGGHDLLVAFGVSGCHEFLRKIEYDQLPTLKTYVQNSHLPGKDLLFVV
jgi:hypothetical protein